MTVHERSPAVESKSTPQNADGAGKYLSSIAKAANAQAPGENPIISYKSTPGIQGRMRLDEIYAADYPATPSYAQAARRLLSTASTDEKVALARILAGLYNRENTTGQNTDLLLDLKQLANDSNHEVARTAASAFARLGYMPGSEFVLESAFKSGAMPDGEYFGEIAHLSLTAPPDIQQKLFATISESRIATPLIFLLS